MGIFRGSTLSGDALANIDIVADNIDNVNTVGTNIASVNAVATDIGDVTTVAGITADIGVVASIATEITSVDANETNITTVAGIDSDVTTVAGISSNVATVAGMSANIASIIANETNINLVADDIADVATVAEDIADVMAVAAIDSDVTTVAGIDSDVTTVAGIAADVTTVAGISADVTAVAADATDIGTVAADIADVSTVAGIAANVTTVAGISANVTSVASNSTNINTVATNIANVNAVGTNIANVNSVAGNATNINAVASNATNINTVAGISANVTTVATNNANVTTVATNIASVNTNATNIANINQNAANIVAIQNASTNATNAAASATAAASSATSAATSAAQASAVALGNEPVRHSVRPSLLLDFANTKTLDPRITFTRGSTATFYDGKTVAKAEENLLLQSQTFDNASWVKTGATVTSNTTTAPDGTSTADSLIAAATSGFHYAVQSFTGISGLQYTVSLYAKANGYTKLSIADVTNGRMSVQFDLTAAGSVISTAGSGYVSSSITSVGNDWYRCVATYSSGGLTFAHTIIGYPDSGASISIYGATYTGDATNGVYIWGAQLEQRSSVTAYTATTTAPITNYIPALQTAASGIARFEHNPVTGESLGLEIEEQRTNLLTYSEQFDNAAWTKTGTSITSNTIVSPDGTLNADALIENTAASAQHSMRQDATIVANSIYTASVFVHALPGASRYIRLQMADSTNTDGVRAIFDPSNGTITRAVETMGAGSSPNASVTSVGNGWYRIRLTGIVNNSATTMRLTVFMQTSSTTIAASYDGDGYSGIYIWGAQVEAGAFATSYIPTVASQITRSADSASMTGTNFSSWYRADEGTLYAEAVSNNLAVTGTQIRRVAELNDGTNSNKISFGHGSTQNLLRVIYTTNGTNTNGVNGQTVSTVFPNAKIAIVYKTGDYAFSPNGATPTTNNSTAIPVLNKLSIGNAFNDADTGSLNGTIKKLAYYAKRLTNEELQGLTTV